MSAPFYVELLDRTDEVRKRIPVNQLPIKIGRGYDNDVILDDPHVAHRHAVIEQTEQGLQVQDCGSRNGIMFENRKTASLLLNGNRIFRLGHSRLRVRTSDFPVAEEMLDHTNHNFEGLLPALLGLGLLTLITLIHRWLTNSEDNSPISYLMTLGGALGGGIMWAGMWALINRLLANQNRVGRHLFIAGCGLAAVEIWNLLANVLGFAFSLEFLTAYSSLFEVVIVTAIIFYHLSTVQPRHPRRVKTISLCLMITLSGYFLLNNYQRTDTLADELYMSQILPPAFRLAPNHRVDQFFEQAQGLKEKADKAGKKPVDVAGVSSEE